MRQPVWLRYLRETGSRAQTAIGPFRFVGGLVVTVVGFVLNVDLGVAVALLAFALFLVEWLVLVPAKMWDEAQRTVEHPEGEPRVYVAPGGTYIKEFYASESVSGSAGTAKVNPAAPRSPRKSRRDPSDQPPLPGFGDTD